MAARPIASATISFGLVSIPVKLFTTVQSSESISFRMIHKKCNTPLKYQYWCVQDGQRVERDDIVKGYEYAKDRYVLFTPEELRALEEEATRAIAIEEFVSLDKIDPVYYEKAYYLGPEKGGERAYRLLSKAMTKKGLAGLARYAVRGKQFLVMVRPVENGLVMQQLRYASEVRPFSEVPIETKGEVKDSELELALQLIEQGVSEDFRPDKYADEVRNRILEVIHQKVGGEEVTIAPSEAPKAQVIDLMEALKASLAGASAEQKPKAAKPARASSKPAKASPRKAARKAVGRRKKASK
ncbi:MAG: Ku protein [Candidatus Krumholzibacteriia bacterium]